MAGDQTLEQLESNPDVTFNGVLPKVNRFAMRVTQIVVSLSSCLTCARRLEWLGRWPAPEKTYSVPP